MIHLQKLCICSVQLWPLWFVDRCHITSLARQVGFGFSTYLSSDWTWVWSLLLFWHLVDRHLPRSPSCRAFWYGSMRQKMQFLLCFVKSCYLKDGTYNIQPIYTWYSEAICNNNNKLSRQGKTHVNAKCQHIARIFRSEWDWIWQTTFTRSWAHIEKGVNTIHTSCWHLYTERYYMAATKEEEEEEDPRHHPTVTAECRVIFPRCTERYTSRV